MARHIQLQCYSEIDYITNEREIQTVCLLCVWECMHLIERPVERMHQYFNMLKPRD